MKLPINESNLISQLNLMFSNSFKVINELIQNANRAGASRVDITFTESDDGKCNLMFKSAAIICH
ncbi:hypothetical protein L0B53_18740 (plasmid) [Vibrio sp. SS-MA-C1-2]|uniref:hypothetical protein n=1 Tax=Vibrio sp. SS-MA-C1-2 TaxID=2908646 RepID=UPI001F369D9C|nr:hypothetical protein [Vibrio sp. SS-MA-C1-2]UJF20359.1 hypothetical protein L0B53_18740 [Vibrio sp. SS-MA-C1-2]